MKPPPDALRRHPSQHKTVAEDARQAHKPRAWRGMTDDERRARRKSERAEIRQAAARAWLLQCNSCKAIATGRVTRHGIVISNGFKIEYGRHTLTSAGRCGGHVSAYDITGSGDDPAT